MVRNFLVLCALFAPIALFACGNSSSTSTTTNGAGGSGSSSTAATTSTTATASASSTSASSGGTGGAAGACSDSADQAALGAHDVAGDTQTCTISNLGNQSGAETCIAMMDGLTMACANCFAAEGQCGFTNCAGMCAGGDTPACMGCLATNCDSAFTMCSGITPSPADAGTD